MSKLSEALTYGLTIRESATDGSDFTNPVADYRRLFLGEDGALHLKDSSGTVTAIGGSSALASAATLQVSGADYSTASGSYADIDGTNLSATITTGAHRVKVTLAGVMQINSSNAANIDVLVDGSSDTGLGNGAWQYRGHSNGNESVTLVYVTSALSAGSHTIKLQWKVNGDTAYLRRTNFACSYLVEELAI